MALLPHNEVSVVYHRGLRTGGPEALHQLVDALRSFGVDAWLVPLPGTEKEPRSNAYAKYDAPERPLTLNSSNQAVVFPETWLAGFRLQEQPRYCWWLSADNSDLLRAECAWRNRSDAAVPASRLLAHIAKERARRLAYAQQTQAVTHLSQSCYASNLVSARLRRPVRMLSDYTTAPLNARIPRETGDPVVAFNPAKGAHLVQRVRARMPSSIKWVALSGMSSGELQRTLSRADVYLELGHQPGKDRLPREAAASGAVVIALRRGSGSCDEDLPIPGDHKVDAMGDIGLAASLTLSRVLRDLQGQHRRQDHYRSAIAQERAVFFDQVRATFLDPQAASYPSGSKES